MVVNEIDLFMVSGESFDLTGDLDQFVDANCDDIDCSVKLEMSVFQKNLWVG